MTQDLNDAVTSALTQVLSQFPNVEKFHVEVDYKPQAVPPPDFLDVPEVPEIPQA